MPIMLLQEQIRVQAMVEAAAHVGDVPPRTPGTAKPVDTTGDGDLGYLGEMILTQVATAWMSLEILGDLPELQLRRGGEVRRSPPPQCSLNVYLALLIMSLAILRTREVQ